jgi:hypothetical protein
MFLPPQLTPRSRSEVFNLAGMLSIPTLSEAKGTNQQRRGEDEDRGASADSSLRSEFSMLLPFWTIEECR